MNTVYKYCGQHGVAILQRLEIKITPPNQFNDPFEFTPQMVCLAPIRRSRDILRKKTHLRTLYEVQKAAGLYNRSFRDYRKFVKQHRGKLAEEISGYLPPAAANVQAGLLDKVSRRWGILCLSRQRDSILMWGHYCDKHRGLVIGFDSSDRVFRGLSEVTYVRERVIFDASWLERDPKLHAFERQMVFSKNEDWSYEQEVRQFIELSALRRRSLEDGTEGYFLPLPPSAVVSVTLGAKCTDDLDKSVRLALRDPCFSHVKLDRAVLHESKFALEFR